MADILKRESTIKNKLNMLEYTINIATWSYFLFLEDGGCF